MDQELLTKQVMDRYSKLQINFCKHCDWKIIGHGLRVSNEMTNHHWAAHADRATQAWMIVEAYASDVE